VAVLQNEPNGPSRGLFATVEAGMEIPFNSDLARVSGAQRYGSWEVDDCAGNAECAVMRSDGFPFRIDVQGLRA